MKEFADNQVKLVLVNGFGETPLLPYRFAKESGVRSGDSVVIKDKFGATTFSVGCYVDYDARGNKVCGFVLTEDRPSLNV